jgi:thiamine-phosphate pyrophosphorylase
MQQDNPIIYLITPSEFDLSTFSTSLERILDKQNVACVRLEQSTRDEITIGKSADTLREICHSHDIPLIMDTHFMLVEKFGLDGVHLKDGSKTVRTARKALGKESIIGAYCSQSKHEGINATEAGADYVSFGPMSGDLGDGKHADPKLFEWWSETIEYPIVSETGLTLQLVRQIADNCDFLAFREEIWEAENPSKALDLFLNEI